MKQQIFQAFAGLSFFLFLAAAGMWGRSYFAQDAWPILMESDGLRVQSWHGRFFLMRLRGHDALVGDGMRKVYVRIEAGIVGDNFSAPRHTNEAKLNRLLRSIQMRPGAGMVTAPRISLARSHWSNGFGFGAWMAMGATRADYYTVPYWFICLLLAILPAAWAWRWRRARQRFAEGLCHVCGYDLRATPKRCPECGTPVDARKGVRSHFGAR